MWSWKFILLGFGALAAERGKVPTRVSAYFSAT
jgi:hypothetical protein